jgi:hypothetical protein
MKEDNNKDPIDYNLQLWEIEENTITAIKKLLDSDAVNKIEMIDKIIAKYRVSKRDVLDSFTKSLLTQ